MRGVSRYAWKKYKGDILQWVSACIVLIGVCCEYKLKADLYFVMITTGALMWGIAQKINHPRSNKKWRRLIRRIRS